MAFETGSFANAKALFDRIVTQVQASAFMGAGNEWTLKYSFDGWGVSSSTTLADQVIKSFELPGPSGTGDWHVIIRLNLTGTNTANLYFAAYKTFLEEVAGGPTHTFVGDWSSASVNYYFGNVVWQSSKLWACVADHVSTASTPSNDNGLKWIETPSTNFLWALIPHAGKIGSYPCKMWNGGSGDIPYWLVADASRIALVTNSDGRFHFGYGGGIERFGAPSEYPAPLMFCGNNTSEVDTYLDSDNRNIPCVSKLSTAAAGLLLPAGNSAYLAELMLMPPGDYFTSATKAQTGRRPNGDWPLMPTLVFYRDTVENGFAGTMIGVYGTDNRGSSSGDLITVDGQDYLLIEDVYRGEEGCFMALQLA